MILTLDLGTTYFKAALFDRNGRLCGLHRGTPPIRHPRPGRWELDAGAFRSTIRAALAELGARRTNGLGDVEAVTFATQTNSFVLLDADDRPLTPIILWPDDRAAEPHTVAQAEAQRRGDSIEDELQELAGVVGFLAKTGLPQVTAQFMAAKLRWMCREEPDSWHRVRRLCLISDYLTLWLTGQHLTEAGAAGLTGAVDIHRLQWWPEACDRLGLSSSWLPAVVRAGTDIGLVRPEAADELGLPRACRFVAGCLDQFAGAIGAGNIRPGNVSETTGTVLAAVRCADRFAEDAAAGVFQGPAFDPGMYYEFVFGSTSANLLEWYRSHLPGPPSFETLDSLAAGISAGSDGLGVRPDADRGDIAEGFVGMNERHTTGHAVRAIMEAVALALAEQVGRLCGPAFPAEVRSCGGAARSDVWLQIKADVLNVPFAATLCPEPTSLGAAMLAARSLGWAGLEELARAWIGTKPPHIPDPQMHSRYAVLYPRFSAVSVQ
jgi:xylulokinase